MNYKFTCLCGWSKDIPPERFKDCWAVGKCDKCQTKWQIIDINQNVETNTKDDGGGIQGVGEQLLLNG